MGLAAQRQQLALLSGIQAYLALLNQRNQLQLEQANEQVIGLHLRLTEKE